MKKTAPLLIGILVIAAFTAVVTLYAGSMTGRWGVFMGLPEARAAMKNLPLEIPGAIGTWVADGERELDDTSIGMLQIQNSYIFRTYRNTVTQEFVHLSLMAGPTGRVTVHTPEICFGGRDYEKETSRTRVPFNVRLATGEEIEDTFWRVDFVARTLETNNRVSFYWAISTGGPWEARAHPRQDFRTFRFVYKLQVEAFSGPSEEGDTVRRFLEDALPTIHEHLRPCQ